MRQQIIAALAVTGLLVTAGCSEKARERFRDAPRGASTNNDPADVGTSPDGFSNWATKCDHGNRVYVIFKGDSAYGAVAVVPQDPTCPAGESAEPEG